MSSVGALLVLGGVGNVLTGVVRLYRAWSVAVSDPVASTDVRAADDLIEIEETAGAVDDAGRSKRPFPGRRRSSACSRSKSA